jgi:hypothetical protein
MLAGCGGGSGGSSTSGGGSSTSTVTGTAATGKPIAGATITLMDAKDHSKTLTTNVDGTYTIDVSGMTAPFLLKVSSNNVVLFSVGNQPGVVNITPLTDLIIKTWYEAQGKSIDSVFSDPMRNPPPTVTEVQVISNAVKKIVQKWLVDRGIDVNKFDLITTAFNADGSGIDGVLDTLSVDYSNVQPVITINAGPSGSQTTTLSLDRTSGTVSADTSITVNGVTSTSFTSAVVPASTAVREGLNGVLTTLSNLAAVVNAKGTNLVASDVRPFVDDHFLSGFKNADQFSAQLASDLAGTTIDSITVDHILTFDNVNNIIAVVGEVEISHNGQTIVQEVKDDFVFKKESDGSWKFYGNQERVKADVKTETTQRMLGTGTSCSTGCDGVYYDLKIQVIAPTNAVTSATVTGNIGGTTQTLSLTKAAGTFIENDGTVTDQFELVSGPGSTFYELASPADFPAAGNPYTIHVNFADGSTANYTRVLGASTSEAMTLQSGVESTVGHSASTTIGHPVTLSWNLPVTFPIKSVEMYAHVTNTNGDNCDTNGPDLAADATTGTMTLPSTCNNLSLQIGPGYPSITVAVTGISGESTNIWYAFK